MHVSRVEDCNFQQNMTVHSQVEVYYINHYENHIPVEVDRL